MTLLLPPAILIVDDEPTSRNALSQVLRRAGYLVTLAADGDEALALIESEGCFDFGDRRLGRRHRGHARP